MKKILFSAIVWSLSVVFAQQSISGDQIALDSLQSDISAMDSARNYAVGLDTAYLKSVQQVDSQKVAFMNGISLFNSKKYYDALDVFEALKEIPDYQNRYLAATDMMVIKTYLRLGNYEQAIRNGYVFEGKFSDSSYLDDVKFSIAEAHMAKGRYSNALLYFMSAMENSDSDKLIERCRNSIDIIVDIFMSLEELQNLNHEVNKALFNFILSLKIIEKNHLNGNESVARQALNRLQNETSNSFFQTEYKRTVDKINSSASGQNYIGVILPLSGNKGYERIGQEILDGLRVAILRHNKYSKQNIAAIVMDNRGEMVESVKHAKYLAKNPRVFSIFGPVKSENVIAVATFANEKKIPMISPTATNSEITELGSYFFQASVNLKNLGEYLGKYCTAINDHTNVATISPSGEYGEKLTDSFSQSIDLNGGTITSQQWYSGEPEKLQIQMENIRRGGVKMATVKLERKIENRLDSLKALSLESGSRWNRDNCFLNVTDSVCRLYEHGRVREMSIKETLLYTGMMSKDDFQLPHADSLDHKITSIDGIFIPASSRDLKFIIPQLKYYNVTSNIYGTRSNLTHLEIINSNRSVAKYFYFISDYYINSSAQKYRDVISDYLSVTGEKPSRFGVYGFDTMAVLLKAYNQGQLTREIIKNWLLEMPIYYGLGRNISFTGNQPGSNSCAYVLTYDRGRMVPVARVEKGKIFKVK